MKLVKGKDLTPQQREDVKRAYTYRFLDTTIYNPETSLAGHRMGHGHGAAEDNRWIDSKAFYIRKDGKLANRPSHCEPVILAD